MPVSIYGNNLQLKLTQHIYYYFTTTCIQSVKLADCNMEKDPSWSETHANKIYSNRFLAFFVCFEVLGFPTFIWKFATCKGSLVRIALVFRTPYC
jgi:hypothetical protein